MTKTIKVWTHDPQVAEAALLAGKKTEKEAKNMSVVIGNALQIGSVAFSRTKPTEKTRLGSPAGSLKVLGALFPLCASDRK